jgi:hypothetical protein
MIHIGPAHSDVLRLWGVMGQMADVQGENKKRHSDIEWRYVLGDLDSNQD